MIEKEEEELKRKSLDNFYKMKQEQICANCGKTKEEHFGLKGKLYCENLDVYDENSKKFTPKNHIPQVDLNDVLKLVGETLNFSNSKDRLIEKLKALHSQEVDVRRQKEDNNSSPGTQNQEMKKELEKFLSLGVTCSSGAEEYLERWFERLDKLINSPRGKDSEKEDFCAKPEDTPSVNSKPPFEIAEGTQNHKKGCGRKYKMFKDNLAFMTCGFVSDTGMVYLCPTCQEKEK